MIFHACKLNGSIKLTAAAPTNLGAPTLDAPRLKLDLGTRMLSSSIREGSDIYFVCHVDAIPSVREITWLHNETPINESNYLESKPDGGQIIISNNSLVLQRVNMHKRGKYACVASNSEGTGESNRIELRVLRKLATITLLNEQK